MLEGRRVGGRGLVFRSRRCAAVPWLHALHNSRVMRPSSACNSAGQFAGAGERLWQKALRGNERRSTAIAALGGLLRGARAVPIQKHSSGVPVSRTEQVTEHWTESSTPPQR